MSKHDEPAFPSSVGIGELVAPGLTRLEYFSGIAMQGLCTNFPVASQSDHNNIAVLSVDIAAALLDELEKRKV